MLSQRAMTEINSSRNRCKHTTHHKCVWITTACDSLYDSSCNETLFNWNTPPGFLQFLYDTYGIDLTWRWKSISNWHIWKRRIIRIQSSQNFGSRVRREKFLKFSAISYSKLFRYSNVEFSFGNYSMKKFLFTNWKYESAAVSKESSLYHEKY